MSRRCAICSKQGEVQPFVELGFGSGRGEPRLHLCEACLDQRNAKRWEPGRQMTTRVRSVLHGAETQHPQGRYSYLEDTEQGVHLVRLNNDWALSHAEDAVEP